MKVLVTGHLGYLGSVMVPILEHAGIHVVGLDSALFADCLFGDAPPAVPANEQDIRGAQASDLAGCDAGLPPAALSHHPLGNIHPERTYRINHLASLRLGP